MKFICLASELPAEMDLNGVGNPIGYVWDFCPGGNGAERVEMYFVKKGRNIYTVNAACGCGMKKCIVVKK